MCHLVARACLCSVLVLLLQIGSSSARGKPAEIQWIDMETRHSEIGWSNCQGLWEREPCVSRTEIHGEKNVFVFHPLAKDRPAWISTVVDVPEQGEMKLKLEIASAAIKKVRRSCKPDFRFWIDVREIGTRERTRLTDDIRNVAWVDGWKDYSFSLDKWRGKQIIIWLFVANGGETSWCAEYAALKALATSHAMK